MKPEELMIGDWVECGINCAGRITQIGGTIMCVRLSNGDLIIEADEVKPISLTPEILKKNEFELQRDKSELGTLDTYWLGGELGAFRIHRLNNGDYQFGLAKIRNVHELQHALRLCGIDKEIEL